MGQDVTDPTVFDAMRQRAVIRKLQRNAGLEATDLAQAVGLSYPQLLRYAYGKVPIRSHQIPLFAQAFGIAPIDLAAELGGQDLYEDLAEHPNIEVWSFRSALRGHLPESLIDQYAPTWEGRPLINQMAAVEAFIEMAGELREENTDRTRKPHSA